MARIPTSGWVDGSDFLDRLIKMAIVISMRKLTGGDRQEGHRRMAVTETRNRLSRAVSLTSRQRFSGWSGEGRGAPYPNSRQIRLITMGRVDITTWGLWLN